MKGIILIILLIGYHTSYSQVDEKGLKEIGISIEDIVPDNWVILKQAVGDLNQDGKEDCCLAIQENDPSKFELNDGLGMDTVNQNPRSLLIYFANENGVYQNELELDEFIILQGPTMDEPLRNLEITAEGVLKITFFLWYSAGSWTMSTRVYTFKYQNNQFELLHFESNEMHRGSGSETSYAIDFKKKRMEIIRSTIDQDTDEEEIEKECIKFKLEKLKTLRELKTPFEWEFNGIYI